MAPELAAAQELVRSGAVVGAVEGTLGELR
jgi:hypothetical protein